MKQFLMLAVAVGLVTFADAQDNAKKGAASGADKLQGTWTVVGLEHNGKKASKEAIEGMTFVVKGNQYTLKGGEETYRGTLKLDPSQKPNALTASFHDDEGKEKGKAEGIYELQGDRLRIIWREKGEGRPKDFTSEQGTRLIVLERAGAAKKQ
jgi:uncharacterized protein (TIGR03067 family)